MFDNRNAAKMQKMNGKHLHTLCMLMLFMAMLMVIAVNTFGAEANNSQKTVSLDPKKIYKIVPGVEYPVGQYVAFGSYEQDGNPKNGNETIVWIVLDKTEDGQLMLLARYGLDAKPYNASEVDVTWETCSLRTWLNESFYEQAFSEEEKSMIQSTELTPSLNWACQTQDTNPTVDKVFLLSLDDVAYYSNIKDIYNAQKVDRLKTKATVSAIKNGAWVIVDSDIEKHPDLYSSKDLNVGWWWLRSPGNNNRFAARVQHDGTVGYAGNSVSRKDALVRPAIWIKI